MALLALRREVLNQIQIERTSMKRSNFQAYRERVETSFHEEPVKFWSSFRSFRSSCPITSVLDGDTLIIEPQEVLNKTTQFWQKLSSPPKLSSDLSSELFCRPWHNEEKFHKLVSSPLWEGVIGKFTIDELSKAMKGRGTSAPGDDGMFKAFYSHLPPFGLKLVLKILNIWFLAGDLPAEFKKAAIWPIPKPGNPSLLSNRRPIALLRCLWKVTFHIVITQRIYPILERLSAFSPSQAGFRTGKSTGQLIRTLLDVLSDARESGQELHGAFLDLVKAYDCVPWVILGQSLRRFGVPEKLVSFITNAYQGSSATVLTGLGPSPDFSIHNGLRQGCTVSPVLFLIWIQPLLDWLESQSLGYTMSKSELKSPYCSEDVSVSILAFADDLKLFAPSDSNLQALLSCVNSFLEDSCMKVNPLSQLLIH